LETLLPYYGRIGRNGAIREGCLLSAFAISAKILA
jgi:hypothetical protein